MVPSVLSCLSFTVLRVCSLVRACTLTVLNCTRLVSFLSTVRGLSLLLTSTMSCMPISTVKRNSPLLLFCVRLALKTKKILFKFSVKLKKLKLLAKILKPLKVVKLLLALCTPTMRTITTRIQARLQLSHVRLSLQNVNRFLMTM